LDGDEFNMTPEQREGRLKKLVSAAKALFSLQVGLIVGSNRIIRILYWLGPEFESSHLVFSKFINSIPIDIPVGSARLLWNPDVILKTDSIVSELEYKYRKEIMNECIEIIRRYG
jgi:hypothetical protein